jgi:hypothetical protein
MDPRDALQSVGRTSAAAATSLMILDNGNQPRADFVLEVQRRLAY